MLKSRIGELDEFLDAVARVSRGGSVVDPALVQELVAAREVGDPLEELTPREREVLALIAEGHSNAGIGRRLWITESTVERHVHSIMMKLPVTDTDDVHRRVLAAITFLDANRLPKLAAARIWLRGERPADRLGRDLGLREEAGRWSLPRSDRRTGFVVGRDQDHIRDGIVAPS